MMVGILVDPLLSQSVSLESCDPPCNDACQICSNSECIINSGWCYIDKKCYLNGQLSKTDSFTCLQCQSDRNQTQWSFYPECAGGSYCRDESSRAENTCSQDIRNAFYTDSDKATLALYNFDQCGQEQGSCESGFFQAKGAEHPFACCPGYFCPVGQVCMIPCRPGAYCPSPLLSVDGFCQIEVTCPKQEPNRFEQAGCGGSSFEGFCPANYSCPNPTVRTACPNTTSYCPTGVVDPLPCLSHFECYNGRVHRGNLYRVIFIVMAVFLIFYVFCAVFSQWLTLKANLCSQKRSLMPYKTSDYFIERNTLDESRPEFQLNIHLERARLRDVTRFNPSLNPGFTGRIAAGRITALMGGSGCGKSSLLDTIHGRRRVRDGRIKFAGYEPLSNILSDYIGYVPQSDVMHDDLTVFETVYYSARTRRLGHSKNTIKQDVCFVLEKLGLPHMHNNMTKTLSGGKKQMIGMITSSGE